MPLRYLMIKILSQYTTMSPANYNRSYGERAIKFTNPTAKLILDTMERKKTNLAVSVDVTKTHDLLAIIDVVSPYVCLIKVKLRLIFEYLFNTLIFSLSFETHIDILDDFDHSLIERLQSLSQERDFVIFEDRKFADIGQSQLK